MAAPLPKKSPNPTLLLPEHNSKMKKITKSKLKAIIKEEIQNVVGTLQEIRMQNTKQNWQSAHQAGLALLKGVLADDGTWPSPKSDAEKGYKDAKAKLQDMIEYHDGSPGKRLKLVAAAKIATLATNPGEPVDRGKMNFMPQSVSNPQEEYWPKLRKHGME